LLCDKVELLYQKEKTLSI